MYAPQIFFVIFSLNRFCFWRENSCGNVLRELLFFFFFFINCESKPVPLIIINSHTICSLSLNRRQIQPRKDSVLSVSTLSQTHLFEITMCICLNYWIKETRFVFSSPKAAEQNPVSEKAPGEKRKIRLILMLKRRNVAHTCPLLPLFCLFKKGTCCG